MTADVTAPGSSESNAAWMLGVWKRRKWLAMFAFAAPAAVVLGLVTSLPNVYRSSATVLVEEQQVPEAFVRPTVTGELDTRLQTISQEILSRSRLETLITRFNLYARLRTQLSTEELIARMRSDIALVMKSDDRVRGAGKTVAFMVSYRGSDPATVAQVTNTLASFYIEENLKARGRQATGTADFLRAQLQDTKKQLDVQERRVSEYSRRYLGELPQQMTMNLAALEQLSTQLRLNGDRQTLTLARREVVERQMADAHSLALSAAATRGGPAAAALPGAAATDSPDVRLRRLRQQLTPLLTQYTERYPEVIRLRAEIAALERESADTPAEPVAAAAPATPAPPPPDPAVRRLAESLAETEAEIKALRNDERRLKDAIAVYQARVEHTPQREQEFQEVTRDYQSTKDHYQTMLKRYQEAQLAEDMEQRQKGEQFRILDPALPAMQPSAPKRSQLLIMGVVLSLGLAAGAVLLAEHLDTSFHSADALREFTELPVLVAIPLIVTLADRRAHRRRLRLGIVAMLAGLVVLMGTSHYVGRGNERLVSALSHEKS